MSCIYKITNKINGKVYIGQTYSSLENRWHTHKNAWKGHRHCQALYDAFDKYGIDNFQIEEIEKCDITDLNDREIYWIEQYNSYENGYNLTRGGDGNVKLDYPLIYALWDNGLTTSQIADYVGATREGIAKVLQGYSNFSLEESIHRGAKRGGIGKGKRIEQYTLDGEYIMTFPNATVAAESLGKGRAESNNIRSCAHGRRKSAYGYKWKFEDENDLG
jgi:hypothetical protein